MILGATPIGNLSDITIRLRDALETVPVIACEDTRTTQRLLRGLGISHRPRLIALHEHNERDAAVAVARLAADQDVLVLSDAGMPAVSDPGFRAVQAAIAHDVMVTCLPGVSAVLAGLVLSGLPTDRFAFDGFVPRKSGDRMAYFESVARETRTLIVFETPHRIGETLVVASRILGSERRAAVCRELTKMHEEVRRGTLGALSEWAVGDVRGEIVLVIAGANPAPVSFDVAVSEVATLVDAGMRLKEACAQVSADTGHSSRALYQATLAN